jgi:hypothetical protein
MLTSESTGLVLYPRKGFSALGAFFAGFQRRPMRLPPWISKKTRTASP